MPLENGNPIAGINADTRRSVLLVTHDSNLWTQWRKLDTNQWLPARGTSPEDLKRWAKLGHSLVLLDTGLPGLPGWSDPFWAGVTPDLRILAASTMPNPENTASALQAGCAGLIHAYAHIPTLDAALLSVQNGALWIGRDLMSRILRQVDQRLPIAPAWSTGLTERETEVAQRAARGESNQDIADGLNITERTVRAHLSSVFEKLGVQDRLRLALKVHGIQP
ncbi:MAG: response regulator transcription factor [Alcaligenaceae bacterium]|nr:response regulator transcription factor [Alcaligenaceae bacterium]